MSDRSSKVPPHNTEAEQAVLASILIDANVAAEFIDIIQEEYFYTPAHKIIFSALQALARKGQALDLVTLATRLQDENNLDKAGGIDYISELVQTLPNAANVSSYLDVLREKNVLRQLISAGAEISRLGFSVSDEIDNLIDKAQDITSELGEKSFNKRDIEPINEVLLRSSENLTKIIEEWGANKDVTGVPSGFAALDKLTNGFQKSDLIIVAGRPGMGKTSFGLNVLLNAAKAGKKCAFFSLEMSSEQLVNRLISSEGEIGQNKLRTGNLTHDETYRHAEVMNTLSKFDIYLDDTSQITVNQIKAKCRKLFNKKSLDMIFVDYLQIMGYNKNAQNREQQISEISRSLKGLAKEYNVPVMALAQVNRNVEKSENKRPNLSDLRESGAIEQDADIIMFLYRDDFYDKNTPLKNIAEIIVAKHRNGETGTAYVGFNPSFTQFDGKTNINQDEVRELIRMSKGASGRGRRKKPLAPGEVDE